MAVEEETVVEEMAVVVTAAEEDTEETIMGAFKIITKEETIPLEAIYQIKIKIPVFRPVVDSKETLKTTKVGSCKMPTLKVQVGLWLMQITKEAVRSSNKTTTIEVHSKITEEMEIIEDVEIPTT